MRVVIVLCACLALWPQAAVAQGGDIDEYAVRQQIRKHHPDYTRDQETQVFLLHKLFPEFKYDTDFDGQLSPTEIAAAVSEAKADPKFRVQLNDYRNGSRKIPTKPSSGGAGSPTAGNNIKPDEPVSKVAFILRRKFDQVSALAFPSAADKDAAGAQLSFARDNVASNSVWAA